MDIALAIERLIPVAKYGGSVTANTKTSYDALRWEDTRPKPRWTAIQRADSDNVSDEQTANTAKKTRLRAVRLKMQGMGLTKAQVKHLSELMSEGGVEPA